MWLRSVKAVFETAVNPRTFHVVAANAFACLAEEHLNTVRQLACKAVFNNGFLYRFFRRWDRSVPVRASRFRLRQ